MSLSGACRCSHQCSGISARALIQGLQGEQGPQGIQGETGPQGEPGVDGINSIMQIIQNINDTQINVDDLVYTSMQWYNLSDVDSLMEITLYIQENSKIFVQFSGLHELSKPASIWIRIVVDNYYNSAKYICSVGPPASGVYKMSGHIEFLTNSLNAGSHTIEVQFLRESGSPVLLDRTLTVMEIVSQ